jgi:hypothetical protein
MGAGGGRFTDAFCITEVKNLFGEENILLSYFLSVGLAVG